ncbi:MAG TPA: DUF3488 and transglutaminase-like domain-containing protein [Nitrospira sp.]|nr:DUF3488 and transglutaminase-like domain-containing protein [Nitrospira sp.]
MVFNQACRVSAIVLAATAFVGLLFARSVPVWLATLTLTVLVFATLQTFGWPGRKTVLSGLPAAPSVWNSLLIGAFLLFLLDLTVISRELLPAGIHFLVLLLNVKLMTLHDRRDYRHLYAISLMAILASAALTTDVWYISVFILYLLAAVWSLLLHHLTGGPPSANPAVAQVSSRASWFITSRFFWLTNGIAVLTFLFTLVIFFILPRVSIGVLQQPRGEGLRTTGFSERVDLGMIGSVKEDRQIVMRVELPDQADAGKERFYLRGLAYDQYNGRSWSSGSRQRRTLGSIADGVFAVRSGANRTGHELSEPLRQDILLEALDTSVLFAAPFAEFVSADFIGIHVDSMAGLHLPYTTSSRIRYSVVSREHRISSEDRAAAELEYASAIRDHFLQIPEGSDQVRHLARRVTESAVTPHERTTAILNHLQSEYQYSLDAETSTSLHPIDDFLFHRKTGYCEHYATAMVIMLRTLGIPARLVTGFLATEWNEFGGYYTVRQRDAHAWVEVFYPHSGWITLDPTPTTSSIPSPSMWEGVQRLGESIRLHWDRAFIRYSARDQMAVIHSFREGSDSARDAVTRWTVALGAAALHLIRTSIGPVQASHPIVAWTLLLASVIALSALILAVRHRWPSGHFTRGVPVRRQQQIVQHYRSMLRIVARRGIRIAPSTTPTELMQHVRQSWSEAESAVAELTALYCRGRFGNSSLSSGELVRAVEQIRDLQRLARASQ